MMVCMFPPLIFLSTPSARRATNFHVTLRCCFKFLSTPSARRATSLSCYCKRRPGYFYPRPPRGGRRDPRCELPKVRNFYPRPPRGGRRRNSLSGCSTSRFLSTPSARRATSHSRFIITFSRRFLSTPSARRATLTKEGVIAAVKISIHALREEGDTKAPTSP